jgi:multiple antibiotic resistance protein
MLGFYRPLESRRGGMPMTILSAALLLFLVMDPFGNIPFFLSALKSVPPQRYTRIILRELCIALAVLLIFLVLGRHILRVLQISEPSLSVAGGIILFLIAVKMIFPQPKGQSAEVLEGEPFIVPLAIPYVAGPSAMASVLLIMSREPERWLQWLLALLLAWFGCGIILLASSRLRRFLRERGLVAMERLMGMVLTTIAVQMLLDGLSEFLQLHSL